MTRRFTIAGRLALLAFLLLGVNAPAWGGRPDEAPPRDRGGENRLICAGMGFQNGYLDGYAKGVDDARFRGRTDIRSDAFFQKADRGYSDAWRYYVLYQRAYRKGFDRGYAEGFAGKANILIDRFYDLEEDVQAVETPRVGDEDLPRPQRGPVVVPAGARIILEINDYLTTRVSRRGDPFTAEVVRDVYVGNTLAIPATSVVFGRVGRVVPAPRGGGRAELNLDFETLKLPTGEELNLSASLSGLGPSAGELRDEEGTIRGESSAGRNTATVAGTSAGGAVIGGIAGGGKGAGIGALVGGLIGLAGVLNSKGKDIEIPQDTGLEITLDDNLSIERTPMRPPVMEKPAPRQPEPDPDPEAEPEEETE